MYVCCFTFVAAQEKRTKNQMNGKEYWSFFGRNYGLCAQFVRLRLFANNDVSQTNDKKKALSKQESGRCVVVFFAFVVCVWFWSRKNDVFYLFFVFWLYFVIVLLLHDVKSFGFFNVLVFYVLFGFSCCVCVCVCVYVLLYVVFVCV